MKMKYIIDEAKRELLDRTNGYPVEAWELDENDISEVAEAYVPTKVSTLLELAAEDHALATDIPEVNDAYINESSPANIIATNVYERLCDVLGGEVEKMENSEVHYHA